MFVCLVAIVMKNVGTALLAGLLCQICAAPEHTVLFASALGLIGENTANEHTCILHLSALNNTWKKPECI